MTNSRRKRGRPIDQSQQLCWMCAKATGECNWSKKLKPVKGWTAKRVHHDKWESWLVKDCPEFEHDGKDYSQ